MEKKCAKCNVTFKANHGKQKFCSDKCKVAYARKKEVTKVLDEVITPEFAKEMNAELKDIIKKTSDKEKWVTEIENYCQEINITPNDLIMCHKDYIKWTKKNPLKMSVPHVWSGEKEVIINDLTAEQKKSNYGINTKGLSAKQLEIRKSKLGF